MGQLVVRNIENAVKTRLQRRAQRHGRSMEEEVRDILRSAVSAEGYVPAADSRTDISTSICAEAGLVRCARIARTRSITAGRV